MAYKIMIDKEYKTDAGIIDSMPAEFDGVLYESRIAAWQGYWQSDEAAKKIKGTVYVKEV